MPEHPTAGEDRAAARKRGLRLEYLTIAWNAAEVFVTITLGVLARSLALVAFGLDSVIELFASFVVVWHLREATAGPLPHRTRRALRLIAIAFFALAAVLTVAAIQTLASGRRADESPWGIAYLAATAVVMFTLARLKRTAGSQAADHTLVAEAEMTMLDAYLATGILTALALNVAAGWWWADPLAALAVAGAAIREGVENWEESGENGS